MRRFIAAPLLLALAGCASAAPPVPEAPPSPERPLGDELADAAVALGAIHFAELRFEEAARCFERALAIDAEHPEASSRLATTRFLLVRRHGEASAVAFARDEQAFAEAGPHEQVRRIQVLTAEAVAAADAGDPAGAGEWLAEARRRIGSLELQPAGLARGLQRARTRIDAALRRAGGPVEAARVAELHRLHGDRRLRDGELYLAARAFERAVAWEPLGVPAIR